MRRRRRGLDRSRSFLVPLRMRKEDPCVRERERERESHLVHAFASLPLSFSFLDKEGRAVQHGLHSMSFWRVHNQLAAWLDFYFYFYFYFSIRNLGREVSHKYSLGGFRNSVHHPHEWR